MKLVIVVMLLLNTLLVYSQDVRVFFVANDSINLDEDYLFSRIIIRSKTPFRYPEDVKIGLDSKKSDFGVIEIDLYDSLTNSFVTYSPKVHRYYLPDEDVHKIISVSALNVLIRLVGRPAFIPGLYRSRVKIAFSRYNRLSKDVTSNWSYFYVE